MNATPLTESAGLVDFSGRTHLVVAGDDRASFLHNFCTNDINALIAGQGCEAFICNTQGKVIGFAAIYCEPTRLCIETVAGQGAALLAHLDRYLIREEVELSDESEATGELLLAGATAPALLAEWFGDSLPQADYEHTVGVIAGIDVTVRRSPCVGDSGFLIVVAADSLSAVADTLRGAGAVDYTIDEYHRARIDVGYPEFGVDITDANLPQEVARDETAISFTKGCYLGQETVARIDALGHVNWTLVRLTGDAADAPETPFEFQQEDKKVARITSAAISPSGDSLVALGYVRTHLAKPGGTLESNVGILTIR